jgi:hypothetical protein
VIINKTLSLEILDTPNPLEPFKRKVIGKTQFLIKDALKQKESGKSLIRLFIADT